MEKLSQLLTSLGVSKDEYAVYELLFLGGGLSATEIAKQGKLHRPRVYSLLASLRARGLVEVHMRGKRHEYVAASPEKLKDIVTQLTQRTEALLPTLTRAYRAGKERPTITVHEGGVGVTQVFRDLVESATRGETFYRYSSEKDLDRTNAYLPRDYRKVRDAKKLERFVITAPRIGKGKQVRMERAMKYIPEGFDLFDQDVIELIYADKVAFIDLNTETSFIIESPKLADFHKKLFRLLYQKL
jgi:sugar-specific transcriptional regulator TrmB